ncbi:transglutaminase family protein [Hydrogenivirga sp.]
MLSAKKVSLTLTYLVSLGCFLALYGIADGLYYPFLLFIFILGALNEWKFRVYLPRWVLNAGGVFISLVFLLELSLENIVSPFANMLLLLLSVKSLEDKKPRDIYQMLLLSLFGMAISTTFRLDISFLLLFLYELFLGSVAFMFTNAYANLGDRPLPKGFLSRYLKVSVLFPLVVALATVPFFIILPRTQTPLFDMFAKREEGLVSGISDEVELGKVGEIQQDNTVVFRVYGEVPGDAYWRVSVFDTLLNTKWVSTLKEIEREPAITGKVQRITVILEPTYDTFVPALDYPVRVVKLEGIRTRLLRRKGGYYESEKSLNRPVRYTLLSSDARPTDDVHPIYEKVPTEVPDSIRELALSLSRGKDTPLDKIEAVREFFKRGFSYSLKIDKPEGDPLEHFLFRSKRGNCEFFASATALLLRLMGVPSRVVGGFKGYVKNDYGNYYIVTNSMAHVWVEAHTGKGWVRVDTTPPYVSPAVRRISKFALLRDALISFWYENVVDFSAQKQVSLVRNIFKEVRSLSFSDVKESLVPITYIVLFLFLAYALIRIYLKRIRKTPENLYVSLVERLGRLERRDLRGLLPEEVLELTRDKPYGRDVAFIISLYQRHRFSPYKVSRRELLEGYRTLRKI